MMQEILNVGFRKGWNLSLHERRRSESGNIELCQHDLDR